MPSLTDVVTGKAQGEHPQEAFDARGQKVIESLRQEYPDLQDVSDDDLVQAVLDVDYKDLPEEDAIQAMRDVYAKDIPETPEQPKQSVGSILVGIGKSIWEDVTALPKAAYHYGQAKRMLETAEADPQFRGAHEALAKLEDVKREAIRGGIFGASMLAGSVGPEGALGTRAMLWNMAKQGAAGGATYNALTAVAEGRSKDILGEAASGAALGAGAGVGLGLAGAGLGKVAGALRGRPTPVPEIVAPGAAPEAVPVPVSEVPVPRVGPSAATEAEARASLAARPGPTGLPETPGYPYAQGEGDRAALLPDQMRGVHPNEPVRRPFASAVTGPGADTMPRGANRAEMFSERSASDMASGQGNIFDDVAAGTMSPEEGTVAIMENMGILEDASEETVGKIYSNLVSHKNQAWDEVRRTFPPIVEIAPQDLLPAVTNETRKIADQLPVGRPVFMHGKPMQIAGYTPSGKIQVTNQAGQNFEAYISDLTTQPSGFMSWLEKLERDARGRIKERGVLFSNPLDQIGDMALIEAVGAARLFRVGARNFAQWADDMVREFGDAIRPHLDQVWERSQKFLGNRITKLNEDLVDTKDLLQAMEQGRPGMTWYDETKREITDLVGPDDADMMLRFIAVTSAGRTTDSNATLALKAFSNWKLGRDVGEGQIAVHRKMLREAVNGETFGNEKIQNFYKALNGDENAVVIDRWMARIMGFKKEVLAPSQYRFAVEIVKDLARDAGVTPRQFQAALWAAAKGEKALELFKAGTPNKAGSFYPMETIIKQKLGGRSIGEIADQVLPKAEAALKAKAGKP